MPATLLVFDTIRVGFPTARIMVRCNPNKNVDWTELHEAAKRVNASVYLPYEFMQHHTWIETKVRVGAEPFWICDTDIVLHNAVETWTFDAPIAGRWIPEFVDAFTRRITHGRLHTSLLWMNPVMIRNGIRTIDALSERHPCKTPISYFAPVLHSHRENCGLVRHYLYDTCAQLYHCIGGQKFNDQQNAAFDHLHAGTYSDLAEEAIPGISEKHRAVFANPELLNGAFRHQEKYFNERAIPTT
jgi:hypothetical protein